MNSKKFLFIDFLEIVTGVEISGNSENIQKIIDFTVSKLPGPIDDKLDTCKQILLQQYPQFSKKRFDNYVNSLERKLSKRKKKTAKSVIIDRWTKKFGKNIKVQQISITPKKTRNISLFKARPKKIIFFSKGG